MKSIVCFLALVLLIPLWARGEEPRIPREQAIKIAEAKILQMGYDVTEMYPEIDENNKKWNAYVQGYLRTDLGPDRDPGPEVRGEIERMQAKLRGRPFWNIVYKYKPRNGNIVIGGAVVFVDANNGDILLVIEHDCSEECETRPWNNRSFEKGMDAYKRRDYALAAM